MEIREGIKFNMATSSYIIKTNKSVWGYSNDTNDYTINCNIKYDELTFKSTDVKLTYYPYKVGDWVYDINDCYISIRNKIIQINKIDELGIWCKDNKSNNSSYLSIDNFNKVYRPAFEDEIPKEECKPIDRKEELLMEAKRRYPIGTRILSASNQEGPFTIKQNKFIFKYHDNNIIGYRDYNTLVESEISVYNGGKWAEIIETKTENMNDLDKELQERESKLEKSVVNVIWKEVFPKINSIDFGKILIYGTTNNTIKPNLIKHNNSRFQKLLIIRTNKSKHSGKTK